MMAEEFNIELTDTAKQMELGLNICHREIRVSENMHMVLFQTTHKSNITLIKRFENQKPQVGFNFCVEGATSFTLPGGCSTAYTDNKKISNFLIPVSAVTQRLIVKPTISLLTLYIELHAFIKIIGESIEALPFQFLDALHTNKCYFENYRWQSIVKNILPQLFHSQMSPLAQRIFIESKSLELIAIILDIHTKGNPNQYNISKSDRDKIYYARELLISDIANPPSLSKLALQAGTNEFTLKKGFKELFSVPVFKYLQHMRLAKAYELFQATNLQVAEVATIIGYESVSSFNRAFLHFYGLKPSDVKRIPFKTI